jgi:hypothetical protein
MRLEKRRAIMHVLGSRRPDMKVLGKPGHLSSCVQNAGPRAYVKLLRKYIALIENLGKAIADINVSGKRRSYFQLLGNCMGDSMLLESTARNASWQPRAADIKLPVRRGGNIKLRRKCQAYMKVLRTHRADKKLLGKRRSEIKLRRNSGLIIRRRKSAGHLSSCWESAISKSGFGESAQWI